MFCIHCGTQLPDESVFCSKCGKPQQQSIQSNRPTQSESSWEACEIMFGKRHAGFSGPIYWFYAEVLGSKGLNIIGKTKEVPGGSQFFDFPKSSDKMAVLIHTKLVTDLLADGWEAVSEKGITWWSYRFRRKAGSIKPKKICEISYKVIRTQLIPTIMEIRYEATLLGFEKAVIMESPTITLKGIKAGMFAEQSKSPPEAVQGLNNFIEQLIRAGWELEKERGNNWWNKRLSEKS